MRDVERVTPNDESELSEAVRSAKASLRIRGGGTRDIGRVGPGALLSTAALTGIRLYEPGALTLVVRAGTPLAEVDSVLAGSRQRLAFEPMDHRALLGTTGEPSIGGVVAAHISGPRRVQGGAARDHLLGVRFVDGTGAVMSNGGRVMKNVTGYDLVKLMAGSWGTLGVLTELSFKVQAIPEAEATLVIAGLDPAKAVACMAQALGSPYDVSGAAHDPDLRGTMLRVEGMAGSVVYRAEALRRLLGDGEIVTDIASAARWRDVRDVAPFAGQRGAVWKVSVKPSDAPILLQTIEAAGLHPKAVLDWGGGLVWLRIADAEDGGALVIRAATDRLGGHGTLVRGSVAQRASIPAFHPPPPAMLSGIAARAAGQNGL